MYQNSTTYWDELMKEKILTYERNEGEKLSQTLQQEQEVWLAVIKTLIMSLILQFRN